MLSLISPLFFTTSRYSRVPLPGTPPPATNHIRSHYTVRWKLSTRLSFSRQRVRRHFLVQRGEPSVSPGRGEQTSVCSHETPHGKDQHGYIIVISSSDNEGQGPVSSPPKGKRPVRNGSRRNRARPANLIEKRTWKRNYKSGAKRAPRF